MNEKLYLNKKLVDLGGQSITRKLQIGKIGEIDKRKSSSSYTFNIPKTSNNKEIFDMLTVEGNSSRKPFEKVVADYIVNDIPLVINGYAKISYSNKNINVNIYDGLIELKNILGDKLIGDLPMGTIDHILTAQRYKDNLSKKSNYIYALANFNFRDEDPGQGFNPWIVIEEQFPSLYVHTIFRLIFESNNIPLYNDFFISNQEFLKEVITPTIGYEIPDESLITTQKGEVLTDIYSRDVTKTRPFKEVKRLSIIFDDLTIGTVSGEDITINVADTYELDAAIDYSLTDTNGTINIRVNNDVKASFYLDENKTQERLNIILDLEVGDVVNIELLSSSKINETIEQAQSYKINYSGLQLVAFFIKQENEILETAHVVRGSNYIAEIKQIDFIKDVFLRYGLILQPNEDNDFFIKTLEGILNNTQNAIDFSSKLGGKPKENYINNYAKKNYFKYSYEEEIKVDVFDYPNIDSYFEIDNYFAQEEKTLNKILYQVPFKRPTSTFYIIELYDRSTPDFYLTTTKVKLMSVNRVDEYYTMRLFGADDGLSISTDVPKLSLINCEMSYFINNYYNKLKALINDYREVELTLNLSVIDIYNLDFFKLFYLKQTGKYYYIDSITNKPNKLSKVKALEVK